MGLFLRTLGIAQGKKPARARYSGAYDYPSAVQVLHANANSEVDKPGRQYTQTFHLHAFGIASGTEAQNSTIALGFGKSSP